MAKKPTDKRKRSALAATQAPGRPAKLQVGALCWRRSGAGVAKVLLITSRDTGRWVIPKGWPMRRRTEAEAAAREAYEEAGVKGETGPAVGLFGYDKNLGHGRRIFCVVRVFPLEVRAMERKYPEFGQRRVKWFPVEKAAERVEELELAAIIREFGAALDAGEGAPGDDAEVAADGPLATIEVEPSGAAETAAGEPSGEAEETADGRQARRRRTADGGPAGEAGEAADG